MRIKFFSVSRLILITLNSLYLKCFTLFAYLLTFITTNCHERAFFLCTNQVRKFESKFLFETYNVLFGLWLCESAKHKLLLCTNKVPLNILTRNLFTYRMHRN